MKLSRRDLAVAGTSRWPLRPGRHAPSRPGARQVGDEEAVKKAVADMRTAYLNRTRPRSRR